MDPVVRFLNETPDRSPMTDWYFTTDARKRGFTARPVVGGVFLQMLYDREVWSKYAGRDKTKAAGWAPMPKPPRTVTLVPTSQTRTGAVAVHDRAAGGQLAGGRFRRQRVERRPGRVRHAGKRRAPSSARSGTPARSGFAARSNWRRRCRRAPRCGCTMTKTLSVYLNGVLVLSRSGFTTDYEAEEIDAKALRTGRNVLAIHCRQTTGGQYIDAGLDAILPDAK